MGFCESASWVGGEFFLADGPYPDDKGRGIVIYSVGNFLASLK